MLSSFKARGPLAFGLHCLLSLSSVATALSVPRADADAPRAAIAVKLDSKALRVRATGEEIVQGLVQKAQEDTGLAKRDGGFTVHPLFSSSVSEKLAELVQRAAEVTPDYEAPDFGAWYQVKFETAHQEKDAEVVQILTSLSGSGDVASAQRLAGPPPPAVNPEDDEHFSEQGYLTGGGVGIDAVYAWGFPGGDGEGTTVIDVERGWKLDHVDFPQTERKITLLGEGQNVRDRFDANYPHGTSVLGEMLMVDNTIGGVGIAPSAQGHVVGIQRTVGGGPVENQPAAIAEAAGFLEQGDVLLLEMQTGAADDKLWPVELLDAEFEAIQLATAAGIVVIEPAGNGNNVDVGSNLDEPVTRTGEDTPRGFLVPGHADFRDSGAIMVGAATSALPRRRMPWSNFGARVDVHSWGENIFTTTIDSNYDSNYHTFEGTSGAAPIVAGAALSIQGMLRANNRGKVPGLEMRNLIKIGGRSTSNAVDKIGVQPDLRALIDGGHLN